MALLRTTTLAIKAGLMPSRLACSMYSDVSSRTVADSESAFIGRSWAKCLSAEVTSCGEPERFSSETGDLGAIVVLRVVLMEVVMPDEDNSGMEPVTRRQRPTWQGQLKVKGVWVERRM